MSFAVGLDMTRGGVGGNIRQMRILGVYRYTDVTYPAEHFPRVQDESWAVAKRPMHIRYPYIYTTIYSSNSSVSSWGTTLITIDVSDPTNMHKVGQVFAASSSLSQTVAPITGTLDKVVASGGDEIIIYSTVNPTSPSIIDSLEYGGATQLLPLRASAISLRPGATHAYIVASQSDAFSIVDLTTPLSPSSIIWSQSDNPVADPSDIPGVEVRCETLINNPNTLSDTAGVLIGGSGGNLVAVNSGLPLTPVFSEVVTGIGGRVIFIYPQLNHSFTTGITSNGHLVGTSAPYGLAIVQSGTSFWYTHSDIQTFMGRGLLYRGRYVIVPNGSGLVCFDYIRGLPSYGGPVHLQTLTHPDLAHCTSMELYGEIAYVWCAVTHRIVAVDLSGLS